VRWTREPDDASAVECSDCHLVYMDKRLSDEAVEQFYSTYNEDRNRSNPQSLQMRRSMYQLDQGFVELFVQRGRFLDYGCGTGDFVASFGPLVDKMGFDIDKSALRSARQVHSSVRFFNSREEVENHGPYDCILFRGTLQYQRDLKSIAQLCYDLLAGNGYIAILATPNVSSPAAALQRGKWALYNKLEHLYYFDLNTLELLFHRLTLVRFEFPYIRTPYEKHQRDLKSFISICRLEVPEQKPFPFWGSMMNVMLQKRA
jgi:SAM-dependent methyltransferase